MQHEVVILARDDPDLAARAPASSFPAAPLDIRLAASLMAARPAHLH
jgi:hypothetical protein